MTTCDHCPAKAAVIAPGTDDERSEIGTLVARGKPDRCWCLACATRAGWPWLKSERLTPQNDHRQVSLLEERKSLKEGTTWT